MLTDRCCTYELAITVEYVKLCNYVFLNAWNLKGTFTPQNVRIQGCFHTNCVRDLKQIPSTHQDIDRSATTTMPKKSCFIRVQCLLLNMILHLVQNNWWALHTPKATNPVDVQICEIMCAYKYLWIKGTLIQWVINDYYIAFVYQA